MDFEDSNQLTVTSVADLLQNSEDELRENQDQQVSNNHLREYENVKIKSESNATTEKGKIPEFSHQFSTVSIVSRMSSVEKPSILRTEWKMILFICILFIIMVVGIGLIYHFYNEVEHEFLLGKTLHFDEISRKMEVYDEDKNKILDGILGETLPPGAIPYNCYPDDDTKNWDKNRTCVAWKDRAKLQVEYTSTASHVDCYQFTWKSFQSSYYPYDCFYLGDGYWYGGILSNTAPFHEQIIPRQPFLTSTRNGPDVMGSVVEPYWLMSKNLAIIVEGDTPLHLSVNQLDSVNKTDGKFCLISQYENSPYHNPQQLLPELSYTICTGSNMLDVHKYIMSTFYATATRNPPNIAKFQTPIYSTWANFKDEISQDIILNYVDSLVNNTNNSGIVVLQEGWQIKHGDIKFDPLSFPNASAMVSKIRSKGFDVGITVTHMVATDSQKFQDGVSGDYLVRDAGNAAPGLVQYWTGPHIDKYYGGFTATLDFFMDSFSNLKPANASVKLDFEIEYMSFEGGQSNLLPYHSSFRRNNAGPNLYVEMYATFASETVPWGPVQSLYGCHYCLLFLQLYDFNSTDKREDNGLQSVLPAVISAGIMGYPFVIPGAIGGSNYSPDKPPNKHLYIRWMQLVTFMPVLHFSIPAENYDLETVNIVQTFSALHKDYVVPEIQRIVNDASNKLYPIIRPMWWYDPYDVTCIGTHDQFMLGDRVLVAPILEEGSQARNVYLPKGNWIDKNTNTPLVGPINITEYKAVLSKIPYFELQI